MGTPTPSMPHRGLLPCRFGVFEPLRWPYWTGRPIDLAARALPRPHGAAAVREFYQANRTPEPIRGPRLPWYHGKNPKAKAATLANNLWVYALPSGAKQEEAAWTLLKYISIGDGAKKALLAQKRPASVRKFNEDRAYRDLNPSWDVVLKNLEGAVSMPQTPTWEDMSKLLSAATRNVLDGKLGVRPALEQAAAEAQAMLESFKT